MKQKKNLLMIGIVLVLAIGFYAMPTSQFIDNELETAPIEVIATSMAEDMSCDMPPLVATNQYGPQDCFDLGEYVDFISATSQLYVSGNIQWSSTPTLPGFDGLGNNRVLKTYYLNPFGVDPGCYTIKATSTVFPLCFEEVTIRVKAFSTDPCTSCTGGETGPGGGSGPSSAGGGDGAA